MLYRLGQTWQTRPSELAGLTDSYEAFCLDQAVSMWGGFVEEELDKIEGENSKWVAQQRISRLHQLLEIEEPAAHFSDPAVMFG